jgi:hypothetical protein
MGYRQGGMKRDPPVIAGRAPLGGYSKRESFPPPFAPFADFFVSHSRYFMSLFPVKGQNIPYCHNPAENGLRNLPLRASLDGRSHAGTGSSKWRGGERLPDEGATSPGMGTDFTSIYRGEWKGWPEVVVCARSGRGRDRPKFDPDQDSGPRDLCHTGDFPWRCNLLAFLGGETQGAIGCSTFQGEKCRPEADMNVFQIFDSVS